MSNLAEEFPALYADRFKELLAFEEVRYWELFDKHNEYIAECARIFEQHAENAKRDEDQYRLLVEEYRLLESGFQQLHREYERMRCLAPLLSVWERFATILPRTGLLRRWLGGESP